MKFFTEICKMCVSNLKLLFIYFFKVCSMCSYLQVLLLENWVLFVLIVILLRIFIVLLFLVFYYNSDFQACNIIKRETPTQVFPCGYCKILKNSLFCKTSEWFFLILDRIDFIIDLDGNLLKNKGLSFSMISK